MSRTSKILTEYLQRQRFNFQKLYDVSQSKRDILSVIEQMIMYADNGMDAKQTMYSINKQNDEQLQGIELDKELLTELKKRIMKSRVKKIIDGYQYTKGMILKITKEVTYGRNN